MRKLLEDNLRRFEELEKLLVDPAVLADGYRLSAVAREHGSLARMARKYRRFKELNAQISEAAEMVRGDDLEMRELAESELPQLKAAREKLWEDLLDMTIGGEDANRTRCIVEIRAGTGGNEAALFARDLFEMYKHFAEDQRWKIEILNASATELGGFKEISFGLEGEGVFRMLQFESGGHRVQRVPETEAQGRIHTSACTVAVMAEPEDIEVELGPDDTARTSSTPASRRAASNKTASAIRLTHYETGIVVQCQDEKANTRTALRQLREIEGENLRPQAGGRDQEASRRTQEQIGPATAANAFAPTTSLKTASSDHRINLTLYKLDAIMAGDLQPIIDGLLEYVTPAASDSSSAVR